MERKKRGKKEKISRRRARTGTDDKIRNQKESSYERF
jgi:hypothetical protein